MRIAVDARELIGKPTGVGRYVRELLAAWGRLPEAAAHEFVLCADAPLEPPPQSPARCLAAVARGRGTLWQQLALPRLLRSTGADVLLAPAYTAPLRSPVPVVLGVHDVSFLAHPEWFGRKEGLRLRFLAQRSMRRVARIVACSEFTRREIARLAGSATAPVDVIYLGTTAVAPPAQESRQGAPTGADGDHLVLYVGSIFARRHVPELVRGFSMLAARHPTAHLTIVGENRSTPPVDLDGIVAASPAAARIRAVPYVPDDQLRSLYGRAAAFVFLSDYEGFGLTPLEALAAGVPIIVLDTDVAREIYGGAAHYVERPGPSLVADAIERVLFDSRERARILEAAPAVLARYSWDDCAARTLQVLLASAR